MYPRFAHFTKKENNFFFVWEYFAASNFEFARKQFPKSSCTEVEIWQKK